MPEQIKPMTEAEMLAKAGSALAKIDRGGQRGASMVTMEESIAMAVLIWLMIANPGVREQTLKAVEATARAADEGAV